MVKLQPADVSDQLVQAVCSIYSTSTNSDELVVQRYCADCIFTDPLVHVFGQADVQAQFRSLRMLFNDIDFQLHGSSIMGECLVIHAKVSYFPRIFPRACVVQVEQFTKLTLRDGRILVHEDHWSIHGTLQVALGLGWIYGVWRQVFGKVSSRAINFLGKRKDA